MIKSIELATRVSSNPDLNYLEELKNLNLYKSFEDIYRLNVTAKDANLIVCFIVFAFDPDSLKLDIKKDRRENKEEILESIGIDISSEIIQSILSNENEHFNNCVLLYLEKLTNWRWPTIFSLLDYHSNMIRFANQKTDAEKSFDKINKEGEVKTLSSEYDIDVIAKVNIQKSEIFKRAISAREDADKLLEDIRKEFMPTDTVVQQDLGFTFTETAKKKVDIMSWRLHIKDMNARKAAATSEFL